MSEARVFEPTAGRARTVTVIPARVSALPGMPTLAIQKKRVAAYARVSTNSEEQLTSYEGDKKCSTPHVTQDELEKAFISVMQKVITEKDAIFTVCREVLDEVLDTRELDRSQRGCRIRR